jgi:hypothetical protein
VPHAFARTRARLINELHNRNVFYH